MPEAAWVIQVPRTLEMTTLAAVGDDGSCLPVPGPR